MVVTKIIIQFLKGRFGEKRGIELRDGFGDKIQSSSWLIKG